MAQSENISFLSQKCVLNFLLRKIQGSDLLIMSWTKKLCWNLRSPRLEEMFSHPVLATTPR